MEYSITELLSKYATPENMHLFKMGGFLLITILVGTAGWMFTIKNDKGRPQDHKNDD